MRYNSEGSLDIPQRHITKSGQEPLDGTVFLALNSTLGAVGVADELGSYLRKLIAMPYFKRGGFKREFLEINGILMSCDLQR
jgi:hypothetical protein